MSSDQSKKKSSYKQYFTRASKRNEEVDKNRTDDLGNPAVEVPNRRDIRASLRGRKDLSVLPLSNTPLYGFDNEEPPSESEPCIMFRNQQDLHDFNAGAGDTNLSDLASGINIPQGNIITNPNNLNLETGAIRKEITNQNIPSIPVIHNNLNQTSLDPTTTQLVKELIVNVQKETMTEMMKTLTQSFQETLRLESQNIIRQVASNNLTSNVNSRVNSVSGSATAFAGDQSQYRLDYRDARNISNQNRHYHESSQNQFQGRPHPPAFEQPPINNRNQFQHPQDFQNANPQYNFYDRNNPQRVQLDKWGFQFNGSNMSVEDFLFRVECKQSTSNYSWLEVYNNFNNLLSGPAEHWYWHFRKNNPRADYNVFKMTLAERYPSKDSDIDLWRKLINRKQKPGESFDDFVDDVEKIFYMMVDQPTNQQLINVIRDNVNSEISTYIGLNRTNSMIAFKHMAREAEKLVTKLNPSHRSKTYSKFVSEVSDSDLCKHSEDHIFVEAFNAQKREYKVFQCKRCSQKFRVDEESKEERRIYCYGCGKEGVIKSNCPVCSENRQTSE